MSHETRHALRTIHMSDDSLDALDEIALMFSVDSTLDPEDLDLVEVEAIERGVDVTTRYVHAGHAL